MNLLQSIRRISLARVMHVLTAPLGAALVLSALWIGLIVNRVAWLIASIGLAVFPVGFLLLGVSVLAGLVIFCWRRHWASGCIMLATLGGLVAFATVPTPVDSVSQRIANLVRVVQYRSALQRQVQALRAQGVVPAVAEVAVGGFGTMTLGIAYDPTGEIMLPPSRRSYAWAATAGETELGVDGLEARRIIGSYYSWFHD